MFNSNDEIPWGSRYLDNRMNPILKPVLGYFLLMPRLQNCKNGGWFIIRFTTVHGT